MSEFIPFALPDIGEEEIAEVVDSLRSGWLTTGPKTKQFEKNFEEFIGGGVLSVAVSSATAGLHLALEAVGIGPGDEVITTTHTFTATAEVVRYLGADVRLVDVDPVTLNLDTRAVREAITPKTKAIIPVHFAGLSCNMNAIFHLAHEFNLRVIEDAAHALPATYGGQRIGSLMSDVTVFSFYANKSMTTAEGGMAVTRHPDLAQRMKVMRLHGIDRDAFERFNSKKPEWYYEVVAPGYKYNLTDIASAIGIHQLAKLPSFLERRKYLAKRYLDQLANLPIVLPASPPKGDDHSWHLFVIRLKSNAPVSRDEVIEVLAANRIGSSVHYVPLHRHPYWKKEYGLKNTDFSVSDDAYMTMVSVPLYTSMSDEQQDRIISVLKETLS